LIQIKLGTTAAVRALGSVVPCVYPARPPTAETVHVSLAEVATCRMLVVRATAERDARDGVHAAAGPGIVVVELQELPGATAYSLGWLVRAAPAVATGDGPAHRSGDLPGSPAVRGLRRPRRIWLRESPLAHL